MMKHVLSIVLALTAVAVYGQQDTVLNRSVTVEREFQPVIQPTGKVNARPEAVKTDVPKTPVQYSDYTSEDVAPTANLNPLLSQPQRFKQPEPFNGELEGGVGHINTLLNFRYTVKDKKKNSLNLYAKHHAMWGFRTMAETELGFVFKHSFSKLDVYCDVKGENLYYTHYGRYYNDTLYTKNRYSQLTPQDKQNQWRARAIVGIQSAKTEDHQYKAEIGYQLLELPGYAAENQVRMRADMNFKVADLHHAGLNFFTQLNFYKVDSSTINNLFVNNRHNVRIEPFYEYHGKRFFLHAGVHLDLNIGKGTQFSSVEGISFAPSPNVRFEAQLAPEWVVLYGVADGSFGWGSLQSYMDKNRYLEIIPCAYSKHVSGYSPIDAELGFRFRPQKNLLLEVYGGYAYQLHQNSFLAFLQPFQAESKTYEIQPGTFTYFYSDYERYKVGANLSYHYRDIINVHLSGNYYFWHHINLATKSQLEEGLKLDFDAKGVYDRPSWDLNLRIDARINKNWSLYSDNQLAGTRKALVAIKTPDATKHKVEERTLPMLIDINLGAQYDWTELNLAFFLQLNNIINRHNITLYGYDSQGINGLVGVRWKF